MGKFPHGLFLCTPSGVGDGRTFRPGVLPEGMVMAEDLETLDTLMGDDPPAGGNSDTQTGETSPNGQNDSASTPLGAEFETRKIGRAHV